MEITAASTPIASLRSSPMQPLNLPPFDHKIKLLGNHEGIFDAIRKKYVRLTPEEWVRQHWVHYLTQELGYPKALLSLEKSVRCQHRLQHRPDIVVYNRSAKPLMLVECKAPGIALTTDTFGQIARYNAYFQASLLVLSNGEKHFCWEVKPQVPRPCLLAKVPHFEAS